uniref:Uncharacterized protein n=1 Tax=Mycena chlorophos TaxID=658473 RepID=A0ABQ0M345_MYCCL|nr:predicted protein [Mycena chlorophos]
MLWPSKSGDLDDVLETYGLVKQDAADVFNSHPEILASEFPLQHDHIMAVFNARQAGANPIKRSIYVRVQDANDDDILYDNTFDVILQELNTVPKKREPARDGCRSARKAGKGSALSTAQKMLDWKDTGRNLMLISCRGDDNDQPAHTFIEWKSLCLSRRAAPKAKKEGMGGKKMDPKNNRYIKGRLCDACGVPSCGNQDFDDVNTILDLPYHFSRQLWFNMRRVIVQWPEFVKLLADVDGATPPTKPTRQSKSKVAKVLLDTEHEETHRKRKRSPVPSEVIEIESDEENKPPPPQKAKK